MRLKEKTHRKFVEFFQKVSMMYNGKEFELAYSDIQRETGAASVTLKRAIQALAEDGVIEVHPGRNSRCARFKYLLPINERDDKSSVAMLNERNPEDLSDEVKPRAGGFLVTINEDITELTQNVNHLRRRVRNQEMAIALIQDRLSKLEDKLTRL
ncbi:MAG: IclR family transcriptional regulator [Desulfosporosinus sp.]